MTFSLPIRASQSPELLQAALQMSRTPMVLADPHRPGHPAMFCNRAFCDLTGYAEAEVIGCNLKILQGRRSDPAALAAIGRAIAQCHDVQVELWNYRKDGTAFWNVMTVSPVFDPSGTLLFLLGSQLDATARREADEARLQVGRMDSLARWPQASGTSSTT